MYSRVHPERQPIVNRSAGKPLHVILVEDDEIDAEAIERAFSVLGVAVNTTRFVDGRAALDALRGPWGSRLQSEPHLILLDLNMPRMNGLAFLDELRRDPVLRRSIVFALTGSNLDEDKAAAYDRRVAGYLVKASLGRDYGALRELLEVYYQAIEFPIA
jgi:CheY-like chemotaxis protein